MKTWAGICRYGGVGDNLIASAVLPALKKKYDCVEVITQIPQHVVFENNPWIDKLSVHKPGEIPGGSNVEWQGWHWVRAKEYDFFANLSHTCETLTALLPGQTQFQWSATWRRTFCGQNYIQAVADVCGVPIADCRPEFFPTGEERELALETKNEKIGTPCVGWVLSGTRIDKIHPASTLIVARLIRELGAKVVLLGAPGRDYEMAMRIQDHVKRQNGSTDGLHAAIDASPENQAWPIRRILTQAQCCDLVIGPDTGPMWAVAMCEMPKIMLLSHASPENITKGWVNTETLHADQAKVPCWPCHQLHDTLDTCTPDETKQAAACISSISVETIVSMAEASLGQKVVSFPPVTHHAPPINIRANSAEGLLHAGE